MSNTFPITGYPLGPGGYDSLTLLRLLYTNTNEAAAASSMPLRGEMENMEGGEEKGYGTENSRARREIYSGRQPHIACPSRG